MFAFGSYFLVFIYVMGTISTYVKIDEEVQDNFYKYILKEHNNYREHNYLPKLKICPRITALAKHPLNEMLNPKSLIYKVDYHRLCDVNKITKNIEDVSEINAKLAKEIVTTWYNKEANYLAEPENNDADAITKIVRKNTSQLGLAMMLTQEGKLHVIALYSPKGNMKEKYKRNIQNPSGSNKFVKICN